LSRPVSFKAASKTEGSNKKAINYNNGNCNVPGRLQIFTILSCVTIVPLLSHHTTLGAMQVDAMARVWNATT
jgi:hypothetical protein